MSDTRSTWELTVLACWVVYDHPKDHPDHVVVRRWRAGWPEPIATTWPSLEAARLHLEELGLVNIGREPGDDPVIAEVWV